jgi:hypothetical protein
VMLANHEKRQVVEGAVTRVTGFGPGEPRGEGVKYCYWRKEAPRPQ